MNALWQPALREPWRSSGEGGCPMHGSDLMGEVPLTKRELDVLRLIASGLSAKQVAHELKIAPRTVERHIDNIRLKTRTRNRAHMVAHAIREGMLTS